MEDGEKSYRDQNHAYFLENLKFCPHTQLEKVKGMHAENWKSKWYLTGRKKQGKKLQLVV